ncbi:MAG: glycerate kinase family protein [Gemmatimonadales bacterium]
MTQIILVAPTAFKGTLGARQAADALAQGARRALPHAVVLTCPVADGGDGLLDAVLAPTALRERVTVTGPLGAPVRAELAWIDAETAIFECASACGLALLAPDRRNPLEATSRGVGELIVEAVERGASTVVVGLGGSACVDGGVGAARGLGWTFNDVSGTALPEGGAALVALADWTTGWRLTARVVALTDVRTPLVGPEGAAALFAPQKGASPAHVQRLAAGLDRLAAAMAGHGRPELASLPGGGAAGGLGAGLVFFAHAELVPGAPWVLDRIGFDAALAKADLVITGEGAFDKTSRLGKATGEVLRRAQLTRKRVAVVAGRVSDAGEAQALSGDGTILDASGLASLGERATREALGLPAP